MSVQTLEKVNLDACLQIMTEGERGLEVAILQRFLVFYGYLAHTAVNSIFDSTTEKAVRQFQQDNGLYENGVVDVETWSTLKDTLL